MNLRTGPGLAALLRLPGIGEKRALLLADRFATWDEVLAAPDGVIRGLLKEAAGNKFLRSRPEQLETPALPTGVRPVSIHEPDYPARLRGLVHPPTLLWIRGTLPPPDAPALAVVGTRNPTQYGIGLARLASAEAAQRGIAHISGLARGIDSHGHEAALDAGGRTWAILGCGVDMIGGGTRAALAERIVASGGGLIAEVPPGTPTAVHLLTQRNRLQSGLSLATLIAQSGLPGAQPAGTMHTARFVIEQDRLLVVAQPQGQWASEPESAGNLALTDPAGCPPEAIYASKPEIIAALARRRPAADVVLTGRNDLPQLWARIAALPEPSAPIPAAGSVLLPLPLG